MNLSIHPGSHGKSRHAPLITTHAASAMPFTTDRRARCLRKSATTPTWRLLPVLILLMLLAAMLPVHAEWVGQMDPDSQSTEADRGTVTALLGDETESTVFSGGAFSTVTQRVRVKVYRGQRAGEELDAQYARSYGFSGDYASPALKVGDRVMLVYAEDENGEPVASVADVIRERFLLWLVIAFVLLLVLVGGLKGVKAVVTLAVTVLSVFLVLIPAILRGASPVRTTILVSVGVTVFTLLVLSGFHRKTLAAVIGTTGGVVSAGLIASGIGVAARLTGIGDETSQMLMYIPGDVKLDFQGLLFAGILLGALGAAMDVAVSMSSAMFELREHSPGLPPRGLLRAGMNIGRDIMGTMANTLILAYTGGAMHLLLLLAAFDLPFADIINRDIMASEVVRALAGSIGLLLTIPITALTVVALTEHDKTPADTGLPGDDSLGVAWGERPISAPQHDGQRTRTSTDGGRLPEGTPGEENDDET